MLYLYKTFESVMIEVAMDTCNVKLSLEMIAPYLTFPTSWTISTLNKTHNWNQVLNISTIGMDNSPMFYTAKIYMCGFHGSSGSSSTFPITQVVHLHYSLQQWL